MKGYYKPKLKIGTHYGSLQLVGSIFLLKDQNKI